MGLVHNIEFVGHRWLVCTNTLASHGPPVVVRLELSPVISGLCGVEGFPLGSGFVVEADGNPSARLPLLGELVYVINQLLLAHLGVFCSTGSVTSTSHLNYPLHPFGGSSPPRLQSAEQPPRLEHISGKSGFLFRAAW